MAKKKKPASKASAKPPKASPPKASPPEAPPPKADVVEAALPKEIKKRFPIVGLGASAGGVEAMIGFFKAMQPDKGMAYAVVMHLDPEHKSAFPEILSKVTQMPVAEAKDGVTMEPDHVYVLPPNAEMVSDEGVLRLAPRSTARPPMPIDAFLISLANDLQTQSAGVVLSGTGSDGTRGLRAIKGVGGITFVQDASAVHSGMPRSAINAGCVDFTLPPAGIADELARLKVDGFLAHVSDEVIIAPFAESEEFQLIIKHLSRSTGVEFNHYKPSTLQRRIQRRMMARKFVTAKAYLSCLRDDPQEVQSLFDETLIQVTSFFRDAEAFEALNRLVFPRLLENRPLHAPIRIWVPGCSTGEEVYSLAIALLEFLGTRSEAYPIKLFATDINEKSLMTARSGTYVEGIAADVSVNRLRRFFDKVDSSYQVQKKVRDLCVFARQDVTADPPFSQLDLISCRNMLIYLGPVLQARVLPTFHYGLKSNGYLFLGMSETIGNFTDLFEAVDKKHKIYRRTPHPSRINFEYAPERHPRPIIAPHEPGTEYVTGALELQREADRVVLARYAPNGVVVDENWKVVQFRGQTGSFLEPAPGSPTMDVLQLAREGLLADLRGLLNKVKETNLPARAEKVRIRGNGHVKEYDVEVMPMNAPSSGKRYYIVLCEDSDLFVGAAPPGARRALPQPEVEVEIEKDRTIVRLKQELAATRAYLQSVIEDKEASNEELKAANEEIVSANEELQSTNEELETAKEELQATNEELSTVNDELQHRVSMTADLSDDLVNLIESLNIPMVVVGEDLRLRRVTPAAVRVLNLRPGDVGRSISDFKLNLSIDNIEDLLTDTMHTGQSKNIEVIDQRGVWYELTISPYRRETHRTDGALIGLLDINERKRREKQLSESFAFANNVLNTVHRPILILDKEKQVRYANARYYEEFKTTPADTEGRSVFALQGGLWAMQALRELIDTVLESRDPQQALEMRRRLPLGERTFLVYTRRVDQVNTDAPVQLYLAMDDITDRRDLERQVLEIADSEQRRLGQELHDGVGQEITGLRMIADALATRLADSSERADQAKKVRDGLARVHDQVRQLSRGLIPVEVKDGELRTALEEMVSRLCENSDLKCSVICDADLSELETARATHLYRIAQEAANNSIRHGQAKRIDIGLREDATNLFLIIQDDGIGIHDADASTHGAGIRSMRYRAVLIGATFTISPAPSGGTIVTCAIPKEY